MTTVRLRARASCSSGTHRAIGPADLLLPNHKIKASSVVGLVLIETNPKPSDRLRQLTVPVERAMLSPEPIWQLCRCRSQVLEEDAFGSLNMATHSKTSG